MRCRYSSTSSREESSPAAISSAWRAIPAKAISDASIGVPNLLKIAAVQPIVAIGCPRSARASSGGVAQTATSEPRGRRASDPVNRNRGVCAVSYPVTFEADYAEQRSRLTTFFRLILLIPVAIVLYVFGIVASIAIVIAWFAIVITGRYPQGLYSFVADFNRFIARVTAYAVLLTDRLSAVQRRRRSRHIRCACSSPARWRLQPPEDVLPHHPGDPDHGHALRDGPAAGDRRVRRVVRDPRHRQDAARPVRPDGARQLLHGAQRRLPVPADRDLPAVPGRRHAHGRHPRPDDPRGAFAHRSSGLARRRSRSRPA